MKGVIFLIIILAILIFIIAKIKKHFKLPHLNALNLVVGELKGGKSITSVTLSIGELHYRQFIVKIKNFIRKLFGFSTFEVPLLYSNIPLNCNYVPLTRELFLRTKRFAYGSVVLIDELSFVADKMLFKCTTKDGDTEDVQVSCKLFFKLFGHETAGHSAVGHGILIANTQSVSDCSKDVRACLGRVFYIEKISSPFWLPFFAICSLREERYTEDGTTINSYNEDLELSMRKFLFPKRRFSYYDSACYSLLTDNLEVEDNIVNGKLLPHLKTNKIVSFDKNYELAIKGVKNEKKQN